MKQNIHLHASILIGFAVLFFQSFLYGIEFQITYGAGTDQIASADLRLVKGVVSHAVGIYSKILQGPRPIRLEITFQDLGDTTSARGGPDFTNDVSGLARIWWPKLLASQLVDRDIPPAPGLHGRITINSRYIDQHIYDYSLAPNVPQYQKVGLLNTMLHELGHCMGFINITNSNGSWYGNVCADRHSCFLAFEVIEGEYAWFIFLNQAERSYALASDQLYWWGQNIINAGRLLPADPAIDFITGYSKVYAPYTVPPLLPGNNASHWDPSHRPRQLMDPNGGHENLHDFGLLLPALRDLGWTVSSVGVVPPYILFNNTPEKSDESQPVFITNSLDVNTIVTLSITGPHASEFSATGVPGAINLVPYQTATINVYGNPASIGFKTATLRAEYNDGTARVSEVTLEIFATSEDTDGDGISDYDETRDLFGEANPFDPQAADSTGENWQMTGDGVADGYNDFDGDGMTNMEEFLFGYNPLDPNSFGIRTIHDTDGDGISDEDEMRYLYAPFDPYIGDSSGDFFSDVPDGIPDGQNDYDGDGFSNAFEFLHGLNPFVPDYDVKIPVSSALTIVVIMLSIMGLGYSRLLRKGKQ